MPLLSKSEIQYLEGHNKTISKSYEYKLKSIIKKKISNLVNKDIPLIATLFPNLILTEFGKMLNIQNGGKGHLTDISKADKKASIDTGKSITLNSNIEEKPNFKTKFYILNNINNQAETKSSGGVEAFNNDNFCDLKSCTIRLSISPSQGTFLTENKQLMMNTINENKVVDYNSLSEPRFWESFKKYLEGFNNKKTIYSRLSYAKRYYKLLLNERLDEIINLSKDRKNHIMKALASLSKYLGIYDKWKKIVEKYNLKWTNKNSLDTFNKIIYSKGNFENLMIWIKNFISNKGIEIGYRNLVLYCALTGLRVSEAIESIKIIKDEDKINRYFDSEKNILKHYEFPDIFIRKTKKAFFSVLNKDIFKIALASITTNYPSIQSFFYRKKMDFKISYCRKVFATYLRNRGIEPEMIDLLQGRISSSVFVNHYYRPDINEMITNKIRPVLASLLQKLCN